MSVEFFKGKHSGMHFFRIRSKSGQLLVQSEAHSREHDAKRGYEALVRTIQEDNSGSAD